MYIITYGKKRYTFKAGTKEEAERLLRRCEVARGQLTVDPMEGEPVVMSADAYLASEHLKSLDGVTFDDPAYL